MKVIIDTSSILFAIENKKDPFDIIFDKFGEVSIILNKGIINEIKKIKNSKRKISSIAAIALDLIKKHKNISIINNNESGDIFIIKNAEQVDLIVTNDKKLKEIIRKRGIRVYSISR